MSGKLVIYVYEGNTLTHKHYLVFERYKVVIPVYQMKV